MLGPIIIISPFHLTFCLSHNLVELRGTLKLAPFFGDVFIGGDFKVVTVLFAVLALKGQSDDPDLKRRGSHVGIGRGNGLSSLWLPLLALNLLPSPCIL